MNLARIAWCAGLIDGDGSIGIHRTASGAVAVLRVNITSLDAVNTLRRILKVGRIHSYKRPNRKRYWRWYVGKKSDVEKTLEILLPHMVVRRQQAELALRFLHGENTLKACRALNCRPKRKADQ